MPQLLIRCPHCGYSKKTDRAKIPPNVKQVKCPRCEQSFLLAEAADQVGEECQVPDLKEPGEPDRQPLPPTPLPAGERPELRPARFSFHGSAKEYFGIWIVNTLLKIITLGVYSAWAKVRKRSYFYGCTQLEGMNFDYLANPIALLKGWLLAAGLFLLYTIGANFSPTLSMIAGLLIYILMPWAIVRSRQFNNRYSAHRNIRFNFYPDYKGAYFVYFWLPMLMPLTLGLTVPYMLYRQKQFLVENNSFGRTNFKFQATGRDFYLLCLRGLGIVLLVLIGSFAMVGSLGPLLHRLGSSAGVAAPLFVVLIPAFFLIAYLFVALYFYVRITNLTWESTRLGRHRFKSSLKVAEMFWIFLSNGVAVMLSCGLLMPWATVRLTRYRLENLTLLVDGSLDQFEAFNRPEVSAVGDEIGEVFGMDIGL